MNLLYQILSPRIGTELPLPSRGSDGAAGIDLCACIDAPLTLPPGGRAVVPTGVAMAIPAGHVGLLCGRSSLGVTYDVSLPNGIGVIDSDYRGEIVGALANRSNTAYTIRPGDRIVQLLVIPVAAVTLTAAGSLPETGRGAGGFGSTGR